MKVGTKSVLFGYHCFFIHPFFVALAWWKLYGFPWDIRLWVAFFVHDIGYWGKPNMDGPEGETHPIFGARIMERLFDREFNERRRREANVKPGVFKIHVPALVTFNGEKFVVKAGLTATVPEWHSGNKCQGCTQLDAWFDNDKLCCWGPWGQFTLLHSRFFANRMQVKPSKLCVADKYAIVITPSVLLLPMIILTGEIKEYMSHNGRTCGAGCTPRQWLRRVRAVVMEFIGSTLLEEQTKLANKQLKTL